MPYPHRELIQTPGKSILPDLLRPHAEAAEIAEVLNKSDPDWTYVSERVDETHSRLVVCNEAGDYVGTL